MSSYNIYPELHEQLLAVVDYPEAITKQIGEAEPWRAFCELPLETKQQFYFSGENKKEDSGYLLRSRKEGREDKEYYHFDGKEIHTRYLKERGLVELVDSNIVLKDFFAFCDNTYQSAMNMVERIVKETENDVPGLSGQVLKNKGRQGMLRFLHYTPEQENDPVLADPHFDRGGFTLHLYESDSGLQYLDWNYQWRDVPISHGKTVVFTGYTLEKFTEGKCQRTWHRVARIKEGMRDNRGRISMVFFVELSDVPTYDYAARAQIETPKYERVS